MWPFLRSSLVTCGMELPGIPPEYVRALNQCSGSAILTIAVVAVATVAVVVPSDLLCCVFILPGSSRCICTVYVIFVCNCFGAFTCVFLFLLYLHACRHHILVTPLKAPDVEAVTWPST